MYIHSADVADINLPYIHYIHMNFCENDEVGGWGADEGVIPDSTPTLHLEMLD